MPPRIPLHLSLGALGYTFQLAYLPPKFFSAVKYPVLIHTSLAFINPSCNRDLRARLNLIECSLNSHVMFWIFSLGLQLLNNITIVNYYLILSRQVPEVNSHIACLLTMSALQ